MKRIYHITFSVIVLISLHQSLWAQPFGMGAVLDEDAYAKIPQKAVLTRSCYDLPASASLKKYAPTPQSQGQYGTCTAWASAYCAYTIVFAQYHQITDQHKIDANTFSPGFVYYQIKPPHASGCSNGTVISRALDVMKTKGLPFFSLLNDLCVSYIPNNVYKEAEGSKIVGYTTLFQTFNNKPVKLDVVKKGLSEGNPIVIGMNCPNSFQEPSGDLWTPQESSHYKYGGHAMCVIGYDDNKYGGAFEIQNSWGTNWGNNGCIWVRYNDFVDWVSEAYEMISYTKKKTPVGEDDKNDKDTYRLSGKIEYQLTSGEKMRAVYQHPYYKMEQSYPSGTSFRLYITNNEPAFVYALGTDATEKVFQIFPHSPIISAALTYKGSQIAIPNEYHYIKMDNTVGKDYLCVLYSAKELDIDKIKTAIENDRSGTFGDKIKKATAGKLMDESDIKCKHSEIEFSGSSTEKIAMAMVVEINHIK